MILISAFDTIIYGAISMAPLWPPVPSLKGPCGKMDGRSAGMRCWLRGRQGSRSAQYSRTLATILLPWYLFVCGGRCTGPYLH